VRRGSYCKGISRQLRTSLAKLAPFTEGDLSIENSELSATTPENPAKRENATFPLPLIVHPAANEIYRRETRKEQEE